MRVVFFGTYDSHRPRFRILRDGLRQNDIEAIECHVPVWGTIQDRSHLQTAAGYVGPLLRWPLAACRLAALYQRLPSHHAVIVPYLGQADVFVARIATRTRRIPVIFDPYVSLYQTVVRDRALTGSGGPLGFLMKRLDRWALQAAHHVLLDTACHGHLYAEAVGFDQSKAHVVPVGAEPDLFPHKPLQKSDGPHTALFYGSMIPLHGIETIIQAAAEFRGDSSMRFTLVGTGQDYHKARALSEGMGTDDIITWIDFVPYNELSKLIADATMCLGIFGTSDKAHAVIPNKVFQCLAVGRPVISGDTGAMREWFTNRKNCILVPPGDKTALAAAIRQLRGNRVMQRSLAAAGRELFEEEFSTRRIGERMSKILTQITAA